MSLAMRGFACFLFIAFSLLNNSMAFDQKLNVVDFTHSQDQIQQGDSVELFFRLTTLFGPLDKVRPFLKVRINETLQVIDQITPNTFQMTYEATEIGAKDVNVQVWIEDRITADELRIQITELEILIADLTSDIASEIDPDILEDLKAQRSEAITEKNALTQLLNSTQRHVRTENYQFIVL